MDKSTKPSQIRNRGLTVFVDTLRSAEFDIKGYQVSDAALESIANNLTSMPFSPRDVEQSVDGIGGLRVRHLEGYDVLFSVSRESDGLVITIAGVVPPQEESMVDQLRKAMEIIATVRGAANV